MKAQTRKFNLILLSAAALVLIGGLAISYKAAWPHGGHGQQGIKPVTSKETLPVIISKVKKLEIVGATILGERQENAVVAIEIKNKSDLAVYFVALSNGDIKDSEYGISQDGLNVEGEPQVVIEPHGTITMNMLLSNLDGRYPIVLSAGGFADGSEEGDESILESIRYRREHDKAKRAAGKGVKP